jgi:hypothetical protein
MQSWRGHPSNSASAARRRCVGKPTTIIDYFTSLAHVDVIYRLVGAVIGKLQAALRRQAYDDHKYISTSFPYIPVHEMARRVQGPDCGFLFGGGVRSARNLLSLHDRLVGSTMADTLIHN